MKMINAGFAQATPHFLLYLSRLRCVCVLLALLFAGTNTVCSAEATEKQLSQEKSLDSSKEAQTRLRAAYDHWRDSSSIVEAEMTIHRPDWERTSRVRSYTKGNEQSLVRFLAPARDAGNASLTLDKVIWNFVPKINRTVKIPPSMMAQSWMGSDFSYRDLSREDSLLEEYTLSILKRIPAQGDGPELTVLQAIPKPYAPVVWGKEEIALRPDNIIASHAFYDQEGVLVKKLVTKEIGELGGKEFPLVMKMSNQTAKDEWTEIRYSNGVFGVDIPSQAFTLSNLARPHEPFLSALKE